MSCFILSWPLTREGFRLDRRLKLGKLFVIIIITGTPLLDLAKSIYSHSTPNSSAKKCQFLSFQTLVWCFLKVKHKAYCCRNVFVFFVFLLLKLP